MDVQRVENVAEAFADHVVDAAPRSIALSGGSTARAGYAAIASRRHDWSATTFWFGDDRCVPTTDPDSNEGMARAVWLDHVAHGPVRSLVVDPTDPAADADAYEAQLRAAPPLDVVHLGLGPDGHTASLFPGAATLRITDRWVVPAGDDRHPHPRLTLTFAGLAEVRSIVVTVAGAEKRAALAGVTAADAALPATRLVADPVLAARTTWLVDDAALGG